MSSKFVIAKKRAVVCKHKCKADCPREQTNPGTCWNVHLDGARLCDSVKNGTPCPYGDKCNRSHTPKGFRATNEYLTEVLPHWTPNAEDEKIVQDMESGKFVKKEVSTNVDKIMAHVAAINKLLVAEAAAKVEEQEVIEQMINEEKDIDAECEKFLQQVMDQLNIDAEGEKFIKENEEHSARASALPFSYACVVKGTY